MSTTPNHGTRIVPVGHATASTIDLTADNDGPPLVAAVTPASVASASTPTSVASVVTGAAVDLTAVESEEEPLDDNNDETLTLLGTVRFSIVGIRYYRGTAHPGEYVELVREPNNPYDRNAVRVDNMHGEKVGHIKREQAATIAPIIDRMQPHLIKIDGTIPSPGNQWTMPVTLDFYTKAACLDPSSRQQVESVLKTLSRFSNRKNLSTILQSSAAPPTVQRKTLDWTRQQKELDDMFDKQTREQLANLPEISMPSHLLVNGVSLYDYQQLGVRWMVHQETKTEKSPAAAQEHHPLYKQVVENGRNVFLCEITNCSQPTPPTPIKGGMLCDEMGLGKTLQTICLILKNPANGHCFVARPQSLTSSNEEQNEDDRKPAAVKPAAPAPCLTAIRKFKVGTLRKILANAGLVSGGKKESLVDACIKGLALGTLTGNDFEPDAIAALASASILNATIETGKAPVCTLIVCPVSVMSNWIHQIESHVKPGVLRVALYHGPDRHLVLPKMKNNEIDVLIVSYHTLAMEVKSHRTSATEPPVAKKPKLSSSGSLVENEFHRVLLDEAHMVRSCNTRAFKAVTSIKAERRLCLTGTPFVNRADDIHSLLSFLKVEPLSDKNIFRRAITQPIQSGDDMGLARLRMIMAHVALRRRKAAANIKLTEKEVELRSIEFSKGIHKTIHDNLFSTARAVFAAALQEGDAKLLKNYMSILETLLRVRQACCSGRLVPKDRRDSAEAVLLELQSRGGKPLSVEEGQALMEKLRGTFENEDDTTEVPECAVCLCEMEENAAVILRSCAHVFCETCISQVTTRSSSRCPLCRNPFSKTDMVKKSAASAAASAVNNKSDTTSVEDDDIGASPKVLAFLEAIKEMKPDEKGVVFSQFTKFLDVIERALEANGYTFTRIDGSKSAADRIQAMSLFNSDSGPRFMLCSLHAAGTGINLTRANFCFLMDAWWNQASEAQAMDRLHRIGQERKVRVVRFVMAGSIEERIVALQEAKATLGKGAMEKLKPEEKKKARITALKDLFLIGNSEATDQNGDDQ